MNTPPETFIRVQSTQLEGICEGLLSGGWDV